MTSTAISPLFARITAYAGVVGAAFLLLSTVLYITDGNGINDGVLGGTVGVWSTIGLAVGSVGIARLLEPKAPTAAPITGAMALAAFIGGAAFNVQAMYLARYDIDYLAEVEEGSGNDWFGFFAFLPWGLMGPLAFVLVGWLVWRTRVAQPWVAALFALGGVLFVTGRPARIDAVALATDAVLLIAFIAIAPALLRTTAGPAEADEREAANARVS